MAASTTKKAESGKKSRKERKQTPPAFAEELLALARGLGSAGAYQAPLW